MSRPQQRSAHRTIVVLHGAGLTVGALAAGLVLALLGTAIRAAGAELLLRVILWLTLALAIWQCVTLRLFQSRWQVPEYWRRQFGLSSLSFAYGTILGMGVFTAVVVAGFWIFVVASLLVSAPAALLGWLAYAVARAASFTFALKVQDVQSLLLNHRWQRAMLMVNAGIAIWLVSHLAHL